jgi:hypothetical protein
MYLKAISIPKKLNEKYTIIPTAGVMLKNKKYFIAFVMAFDIFRPPPIICYVTTLMWALVALISSPQQNF